MECVEKWMPIDGSTCDASSLGRIRRRDSGEILKFNFSMKGYRRVSIRINGKYHNVEVHRLIAGAFLGKRPEHLETAHLDGDKENNSASNLAYVSAKENEAMKFGHGTALVGERGVSAKLSNADVAEIRRIGNTKTAKELASIYGVRDVHIHRIRSGKERPHG